MAAQLGGERRSDKSTPRGEPLSTSPALTDRQQEVLDFIRELISTRGYGPTVREIAARFDIKSPNGVVCHLKALEKKGAIVRESHLSRAITLSGASSRPTTPELPLIGQIAVGEQFPRPTEEFLDFTDLFASPDNACVRLSGSQFTDDHFLDQDVLILRRQATFLDGDVALIVDSSGKASIRRLYQERGRIRLESVQKTEAPQFASQIAVIGLVVALIRYC